MPNFAKTASNVLLTLVIFALAACGADNTSPTGGTFTPNITADSTGGAVGDTTGGAVDSASTADSGNSNKTDVPTVVDAGAASQDSGALPQDTGATTDTAGAGVDAGAAVDSGTTTLKPCVFDAFTGSNVPGLCPSEFTCVGNQGQCKGKVQGLCKPKIVQCPKILSPVCGCDDTTYNNACEAQKASVTVKHGGKCGGAPTACGGTTGVICPGGFICDVTTCDKSASGLCLPEPQGACPPGGIPECGCDNKQYLNTCERLKAKVPLKQKGTCPSTGTLPCKIGPAGKVLKPCPSGQFCKLSLNNPIECTGDGTCTDIPTVCNGPKEVVCGCDFKDHESPCHADKLQISIKSKGSCGGGGGGCTEGKKECPAGTYCGVPIGQCGTKGICINKPPQGQCQPNPTVVCGCDGTSHTNACYAALAGVVVKHDGHCKGP